jgi:hypothetical protein
MTPLIVLVALSVAADKPDAAQLEKDARAVVAAVVGAARENRRSAEPLAGDELTAALVRAAAGAARKLPEARSGPAFALAVGIALDTSDLMRVNPVVGATWKRVESDPERKVRLKVLGTPTVHGRHDLAQHFAVSAALTAVLGEKKAESAGIIKELLDSGEGGSGFSFADLAADLAGIALARRVLARPAALAEAQKRFRVADFALPPTGLVEGLTLAEFEKRYGGTRDPRFKKARDDLVRRIAALPGHKDGR